MYCQKQLKTKILIKNYIILNSEVRTKKNIVPKNKTHLLKQIIMHSGKSHVVIFNLKTDIEKLNFSKYQSDETRIKNRIFAILVLSEVVKL